MVPLPRDDCDVLIPTLWEAAGGSIVASLVKGTGHSVIPQVVLGAPPLELGQLPSLHSFFVEEPMKDATTRDASARRTSTSRNTNIIVINLTIAIIGPTAAPKTKEAEFVNRIDKNIVTLARRGVIVDRRGPLDEVRSRPPIPFPIPPPIDH